MKINNFSKRKNRRDNFKFSRIVVFVIIAIGGSFIVISLKNDLGLLNYMNSITFEPSSSSSSNNSNTLRNGSPSSSSSAAAAAAANKGRISSSVIDYEVDEECKQIPFIRPSGSYYRNNDVREEHSPSGISPSFSIGSFIQGSGNHMKGDADHFQLMKEFLSEKKTEKEGEENNDNFVAIDMGANQGFFSWFLASLGLQVYAFEIMEKNFIALQHGSQFNSREVAQRVHPYPVGISNTNGYISMKGGDYEGFIKKQQPGGDGTILTVSYDCFAYHINNMNKESGGGGSGNTYEYTNNNLISNNVAIAKIDVEGFEIAALQGAKRSLFGNNGNVGALLMEVGPSRWGRAGVDFPTGLQEMKELSTNFKTSYILLRFTGRFRRSCPGSLADILTDKNPRSLSGVKVYKVELAEWEPLLTKLDTIKGDCNFWYVN